MPRFEQTAGVVARGNRADESHVPRAVTILPTERLIGCFFQLSGANPTLRRIIAIEQQQPVRLCVRGPTVRDRRDDGRSKERRVHVTDDLLEREENRGNRRVERRRECSRRPDGDEITNPFR